MGAGKAQTAGWWGYCCGSGAEPHRNYPGIHKTEATFEGTSITFTGFVLMTDFVHLFIEKNFKGFWNCLSKIIVGSLC